LCVSEYRSNDPKGVAVLTKRQKNGNRRRARQETLTTVRVPAPESTEWAREMLEHVDEEMAYLQDNWETLIHQHGGEWVAIRRQSVVAHAPEHHTLLGQLASEDVDPARVTIGRLPKKDDRIEPHVAP